MKILRIGTRKSDLALWQAQTVQHLIEKMGIQTTLIPISSDGDLNLTQPLYALGVEGVFTKALDAALLNNEIDIAVHSLKDVPTQLAEGIHQAAVLSRANPLDAIVFHPDFKNWESSPFIGTGSLRRKAQWLRKFPSHTTTNLRGNLQKRIEKLNRSKWGGALFAVAGLERLGWPVKREVLEWMIPAPGQGAITVCCHSEKTDLIHQLKTISCEKTAKCTTLERTFLRLLEGGCTAPIGALASVKDHTISFKAGLFSLDGTKAIEYENSFRGEHIQEYAMRAADTIKALGGEQLLDDIKKTFH